MSDRGGQTTMPGSVWHWATAALGLALLLATIAFLLHDGLARRRTPYPVLAASVDTVARTAGGHVVRLRVRNDGGVAAANVRVRATLRGGGGVAEEAETTLDYVPPMSTRDAGVVLAGDPLGGRLDVRVTGFDIP